MTLQRFRQARQLTIAEVLADADRVVEEPAMTPGARRYLDRLDGDRAAVLAEAIQVTAEYGHWGPIPRCYTVLAAQRVNQGRKQGQFLR